MIGLDTNVLTRYLTQDDARQAEAATRLIEGSCTQDAPGRVALTALVELVWVLRRAYGYDKGVVGDVVERIMTTVELEVENEDVAWPALQAYRAGPADFADYVVLYSNAFAGCERTYTFDRKLAQHERAALAGE